MTAELPINQNWGHLWNETEVITFLEDVLEILEFVHSQGVIHCDIKPENIIRRAFDGKLVLIDFGSIQPVGIEINADLPIYKIPVTSLGYIPPEQFIDQTHPNSDIYALGIIAIQALTGQAPLELNVDTYTNQISWRSDNIPVNDYLAAILSQMIRYDFQERFQSASEVLRILKQMSWETEPTQIVETQNKVFLEPADEGNHLQQISTSEKSSPLLTGIKVGIAANGLLMGFCVSSLLNNSSAYLGTETLYKATKEYQAGDLQEAISLAKSIPSHSNVYPEAQATIEEWQQQWQIAAAHYIIAENAFNQGKWSDVIRASSQIPDILYWQSKINKLVAQAHIKIEIQTQSLLAKAYEKASLKDFSSALEYLRQIPQESSAGAIVQQKLAEYNQKQHIRANYFLQKAYKQASVGEFDSAVHFLKKIPKNTPVYAHAQVKLIEYISKQRLRNKRENIAGLKIVSSTKNPNSSIRNQPTTKMENFQMENNLSEVNIRYKK